MSRNNTYRADGLIVDELHTYSDELLICTVKTDNTYTSKEKSEGQLKKQKGVVLD